MRFLLCLIMLTFVGTLSSCNKNQVEARREGLIPVREGHVSTFGLESIKD
jgi:hypothetical protein